MARGIKVVFYGKTRSRLRVEVRFSNIRRQFGDAIRASGISRNLGDMPRLMNFIINEARERIERVLMQIDFENTTLNVFYKSFKVMEFMNLFSYCAKQMYPSNRPDLSLMIFELLEELLLNGRIIRRENDPNYNNLVEKLTKKRHFLRRARINRRNRERIYVADGEFAAIIDAIRNGYLQPS